MTESLTDTQQDSAPATPLDAALRVLAGGLLVAVLVGALSLVLYSRTISAPRTAAERDIFSYRALIAEEPSDYRNHLLLAEAYANGGRHSDALASVLDARQLSDVAIVDLTHAEVLRKSGDPQTALQYYASAIEGATREYEESLAELRRTTVTFEPANVLLARVYQGRAAAYDEFERWPDAIEDLEAAIAIVPTDSLLHVALGDVRAHSGDPAGAEEAYREALRFVPDSPEARAGLRRVTEGER